MTQIDPKKIHETLSRYILVDGLAPIFDAEKSHDAYLVDQRSGREYLDLFSFFATQALKFNHPKLANDEFRAKLARVAVNRPTLSDIYTGDYADFVDTFAKIAGRDLFKYYFFVEGGALGVENAIKVAFDWKVRKNLKAGKGEKGHQVIHFKEAFHGRTGYTLSLTNTFDPRKHQYFAKFPWPRVTNPKLRFPLTDETLKETKKLEEQALSEIKSAIEKNPDDIAALVIEPIQAEGGDNHFRKEFFQNLRKLADENEFFLIFDEVQTGMGLTGKVWCFEHFGVRPDAIAFGKKTQIAGCAVTERVDEVPENVFHTSSRINSTWGGNLVDMVRCQRILEVMSEDHLVQNAATVGEYFLSKLRDWAGNHSKMVTNVRGRGLMMAFDLPDSEKRNAMQKKLFENGAIILPCGPRSLRFRPHLDFTKEQADHAIEILEKSVVS